MGTRNSAVKNKGEGKRPPTDPAAVRRIWVKLGLIAAVIGIWYVRTTFFPTEEVTERTPGQTAEVNSQANVDKPAGVYLEGKIAHNVVLLNLDDEVVYRGSVDLTKSLERIRKGTKLSQFHNDGIVFQNRERRLPSKAAGYYHEWVHPTPQVNGPGPQRIVTGEAGDTWYTPDHYRKFYQVPK